MIHTTEVIPSLQNEQAGPTFKGRILRDGERPYGPLTSSKDLLDDAAALQARMATDGYLFLPGLLDRERVQAARDSILSKLDDEGLLDPSYPRAEGVLLSDKNITFRPDLTHGDKAIGALLYDAEMMDFWRFFFGGPVRHFDFTWLRARGPGEVTITPPHCDTVYMGRGTPQLYTTWTPLDAIAYDFGGLMILEGSCHREHELGEYWDMDVDAYCTNTAEGKQVSAGGKCWQNDKNGGMFIDDAFKASKELEGRWLGAEYEMGDVLMFGMHTLHAAADNRTNRIRLSTDSRYQLASEPVDERWIGANPIGHGPDGKKGMIC